VIRCLICVLLFSLLRPRRPIPHIVAFVAAWRATRRSRASLEAGREFAAARVHDSFATYGFALPTAPSRKAAKSSTFACLLDNYFLHLTANQRDAVMADMHKILTDPAHAKDKAQIVAEFSLAAREVRDSYVRLDKLSSGEKRMLVGQAKEEFRRLPESSARR
jgi:hypothetical protein